MRSLATCGTEIAGQCQDANEQAPRFDLLGMGRELLTEHTDGVGLAMVVGKGRRTLNGRRPARPTASPRPGRHAECDDRGARKQLRAAADLAVRCGDVAMASAARTALVQAGGRVGTLTIGDVMTGGERRVAELAARGMTNRQIADSLFVTVRTVESHLSNVYRKLGVSTRADLAARVP